MKRGFILGAVLLVLAGVAGVLYLARSLDSLVKQVIETTGSELTGTSVRVGSVEIDLRSGSGTIRNLRVANPEGFSNADAFSLSEITLEIDLASITKEPIVIRTIRIDAPDARLEVDAKGRSNFEVIQRHLKRASSASTAPTGGAAAGGEAQGSESERRLRIESFRFENGTVESDARAVGGSERSQPLPALRLSNVGGAGGGTPEEIGEQVLGAFTRQVAKVAAGAQLERLIDENLGGEAGEAAKGVLRKLLK
ncbi:MAG: hypothetical protein ABFS46_22380 [Myxococcota bacterium]